MDELWQQQIRDRALAICKREGYPPDDFERFCTQAEQELLAEGQTPLNSPLDEPEHRQDNAGNADE